MKTKKIKKREEYNFATKILNTYLLAVFIIIPLIFNNYYFNILKTKVMSFYILSFIMITIIFIDSLVCGNLKDLLLTAFLSNKSSDKDKLKYNFSSIAFFSFIISTIISTLLAGPYMYQAFFADEARYNGLLLFLVYFIIYIICLRYFKLEMKLFNAFIYVSLFISLFGISDYFKLNLLGFKTNMIEKQKAIFTSTIGNINTYTAYLALFLGFVMCLFIFTDFKMENKKSFIFSKKEIFYFICLLVAFTAIIMGNSDNAYLSLFALFAFIPFLAFKHKKSFFKYILVLSSFFCIIEFIVLINNIFPDKIVGLYGIYTVLANFKYFYLVPILLIIFTAFMYYILFKLKFNYEKYSKFLIIIYLVFLVTAFLILLGFLYYINQTKDIAKYGHLAQYLIFNDEWGTYRAYIWRLTLEEFSNFSILKKIFGNGPDTFYIWIYKFKYDEVYAKTGQFFDAVHNIYIHYLFTHGILGLFSYLAFIISGLFMAFKKIVIQMSAISYDSTKLNVLIALSYSILAYCLQAIVNINVPISEIIFFIFVILLVAISKE